MSAERDVPEQVADRRDELQELAESDNPAAWIAEELLDAADKREGRK